MKIFFSIILIVIPFYAHALSTAIQAICGASAATSCDSCTGSLIFAAHFENNDDITTGTPCGCSTNADKTFALTDMAYSTTQESDGSYSFYHASGTRYASIPTDISKTAGTLIFDIYVTTHENNAILFVWYIDGDNSIQVKLGSAANKVAAYYEGGNTTVSVEDQSHLTVNGWHTVTVKWRTADVNPNLSIQVDSETAVTNSTNLPSITGTLGNMTISANVDYSAVWYIDNVKLYNAWE